MFCLSQTTLPQPPQPHPHRQEDDVRDNSWLSMLNKTTDVTLRERDQNTGLGAEVEAVCSSCYVHLLDIVSRDERCFSVVIHAKDAKKIVSRALKHPAEGTGGDLFGSSVRRSSRS